MRKNKFYPFLVALFMISFMYSCKSQFTKWEYGKTVNSINFEKMRYKTDKKDTILIIGILEHATQIGPYFCQQGLVHLSYDFKPLLFKLGRPHTLEKITLLPGTWISLKKSGRYTCVFAADTSIQGKMCMGGKDQDDVSVTLDMSGNLRSFFAPADMKIDKVFCSGGKENEIGILKGGTLEYCTLSIDQIINDTKYRQGSVVHFDNNGNVSLVKKKK